MRGNMNMDVAPKSKYSGCLQCSFEIGFALAILGKSLGWMTRFG